MLMNSEKAEWEYRKLSGSLTWETYIESKANQEGKSQEGKREEFPYDSCEGAIDDREVDGIGNYSGDLT
jgi:hypothetical protein